MKKLFLDVEISNTFLALKIVFVIVSTSESFAALKIYKN